MSWLTADRPLIIGHRGAAADAPENTLAAFALALEQGADGVELDVQLCADGAPVIIHDATVDRTCNGMGRVGDLTLAELRLLTIDNDHPIPTLDDLFATFGRRTLYNVELKALGRDAAMPWRRPWPAPSPPTMWPNRCSFLRSAPSPCAPRTATCRPPCPWPCCASGGPLAPGPRPAARRGRPPPPSPDRRIAHGLGAAARLARQRLDGGRPHRSPPPDRASACMASSPTGRENQKSNHRFHRFHRFAEVGSGQ